MKKITLLFVLLYAIVFGITAQDRLPDLQAYQEARGVLTSAQTQKNTESRRSFQEANPNFREMVRALAGKEDSLDTPLEIALQYYYYMYPVESPPAAEAILPHSNPSLVDRQLGAYIYKDLVAYRFLNDTAAVTRHEAVLQFITGRGNATRAEIETFYRNSIRPFIAGIVDEEFGKISFRVENSNTFSIARSHRAVLTRNSQNGHYTLSYVSTYTNDETREIKDMPTLDALLAEMGRRTSDFDQTGINAVRTQAALIPAVVLTSAALTEVTNIITAFYTNPNQSTFRAVLEAYGVISRALLSTRDTKYTHASDCFARSVDDLNSDFAQRVFRDSRGISTFTTLTRDQQQRLIQLR